MREEAGLDAPEDEPAVAEELLARAREAAGELVGVVHVQAQELVRRGALEDDHLEVLVLLDRAAEKLHLEARLALEVEDLLALAADLHQHLPAVVALDALARGGRDPERDAPRSHLVGGESDPGDHGLAVLAQLHLLAGEHASVVLDLERDRLARVAALSDHDVHHDGAAQQHRARRLHPVELHVGRERILAEAHREDRDRRGLQGDERFGEHASAVVRAVAHDHDPR